MSRHMHPWCILTYKLLARSFGNSCRVEGRGFAYCSESLAADTANAGVTDRMVVIWWVPRRPGIPDNAGWVPMVVKWDYVAAAIVGPLPDEGETLEDEGRRGWDNDDTVQRCMGLSPLSPGYLSLSLEGLERRVVLNLLDFSSEKSQRKAWSGARP